MALVGSALLLGGAQAHAQELGDIGLNRFSPAPVGDPFQEVQSPTIGGHIVPRAAVFIDHADEPLVLELGSERGAVVTHQTFLHFSGSFSLWDRLLVSAVIPVVVDQGGERPTAFNMQLPSPPSAAMSDIRVGARVRLSGTEDGDFSQFSLGTDVYLPTGEAGMFVSNGGLCLAPHLLFGGRGEIFAWTISLGGLFHDSASASALTYGGGAGLSFWGGRLFLSTELSAATTFQAMVTAAFKGREYKPQLPGEFVYIKDANRSIRQDIGHNIELLFGARVRLLAGVSAGLAAGPGLTSGIGTPASRIVAALSWELPQDEEERVPDADGDGVADASDACPYASGPQRSASAQSGCPEVDPDGDGVKAPDDACPDERGVRTKSWHSNGCPSVDDPDDDGIPDAVDACPDRRGKPSKDRTTNGCPDAAGGGPPTGVSPGPG
ncbi:thrombospondin type 3 repeat-containing protein [Sorangium sp. So ce185]|uniref:thrombospondin type 3 repeat-containing protein n=1 Tax=Sorangium sp. So ce185 TaxID=3133287 RepID=UPI003F5E4AAA